MEYKNTLIEYDGMTAIIKINRSEAMNALNIEVFEELKTILSEIEGNTKIRAVVLTGEGRAFVSGADISVMSEMNQKQAEEFALLGQDVLSRIENLRVPVIAAVNGFALGGGCELAMACDIRYASNKAGFSQPEVGLGLMPGFAGTQRLSRLVGIGKAKELIFSAKMINAKEAYRIGLVDEVFSHEELMEAAKRIASKIASKAPIAVSCCKKAINQGFDLSKKDGEALEARLFGELFNTSDAKEGLKAFLEKSKIEFLGK